MRSNHTCLAVIAIDSALKKDQTYYLQAFSKRVKTDWQRKKKIRQTMADLEGSSDDSDEKQNKAISRYRFFFENTILKIFFF